MKLSICMMVKDEEKNLERCLNSLLPLLQRVTGELIIVDTGSKDKTIEIAKKYTDKVYFHKWNDDFSSMRNITISYAKGEWILIIDADEEFRNVTELSLFLHSKVSLKYNTATVRVNNITNLEKCDSGFMASTRLFRNDDTFRYEGRIHNRPIFKLPVVELKESIINHYGYIETDKNLMEKKFLRTTKILIEEIEKEPKDVYYNYQLAVSYAMYKDYDMALKQIQKTYRIIEEENLDKKLYVYIYYEMASYYYFAGDSSKYEIIEKICKEGLELDNEYIDLYYLLGKIKIFTLDFDKAIFYYNKYINLLNNIDKLSIARNLAVKLYTLDKDEEVYYDLAFVYYKNEKYLEAIQHLEKLHTKSYLNKAIEITVNSYVKLGKYGQLKEFYKNKIHVTVEKDGLKQFFKYLELSKNDLDESNKILLMEIFSEEKNTYSFLNKIRLMYNSASNYKNMLMLIDKFIDKLDLNIEPDYFGDLIYYKLKYKDDLSEILSNVTESNIYRYLKYLYNTYDDLSDTIQQYLHEFLDKDTFYDIRLNKILTGYILKLNINSIKIFDNIFTRYVDYGIRYVNMIYSDFVIKNEMIYDIKNEEEVFFIYLSKANNIKDVDQKQYVHYLRKALSVYPFMKIGIEQLLKDLNKDFNNQNYEFEQYKIQVKDTIRALIDNRNFDEASKIIYEYEQIVKDDVEMVFLKSQIALKKIKNVEINYKM